MVPDVVKHNLEVILHADEWTRFAGSGCGRIHVKGNGGSGALMTIR